MERYTNKRSLFRTANGRFRNVLMSDLGIMGVCPNCNHLLLRVYDGDKNEKFPDPRKFRNRCFTCEPDEDTKMETPRQQGAIFLVPEQDMPNCLCLVDDSRKEALLGTPRQYRELLSKLAQDTASPYRLMATSALAKDYAKVQLFTDLMRTDISKELQNE